MSDILSDLTAATTPLAGADEAYVVQGGNSRKTTVEELRGLAADLPYDNALSGLTADDAQEAIDEITALLYASTDFATAVHAASSKATPVDADELGLVDSAASFALKKLTWANAKATLKTYFDTLYSAVGATFTTASTTEVLTGTDTAKGVTADALAALWEKGADVASAGTVTFGEGGYSHITGTTTITDIDFTTAKNGRWQWVIFDGILTLTHHATTLKLPTGANITTAADDRALFVQDNSDNVICLAYIRADGTPLAGSLNINGLTEDTSPDESADFLVTYDTSAATHKKVKPYNIRLTESFIIAVGDETSTIATGTAKVTWRMPYPFTVTEVRASLNTVSSSGLPTVDINESGVTILSTKLTIDASEFTSVTAATPAVISDAALADDAEMTIDIDTAGTGAKGLKVVIIGVRA